MAWTEDRVEILSKLWLEGLSASQIAKQLGGVTRNAVIGKVHRLGLSGRAKPSRPARAPARRPAAAKPKPRRASVPAVRRAPRPLPVPPPPPLEAKPMDNGEFATILTITDNMCKWPIGDPGSAEFRFCGRGAGKGETYCSAHSRLAYQPARRRVAAPKSIGAMPKRALGGPRR